MENAKRWIDEIKRYQDKFKEKFENPGNDVVKRFRAEHDKADLGTRFNILWSNVATLKPAVYAKPPKPEVSRRFKDKNPVSRVASTILERCLSYEITQYQDYDSALSNAVLDRLLPGRGVAWVRYEPQVETVEEATISEDVEPESPLERVASELSPVDYVYWKDFAHDPARTWEEVTWVARKVCIGREEGVKRFGDAFKRVPLTDKPYDNDDAKNANVAEDLKKGEVWELWCKDGNKVYWFCEHYDDLLDVRDDPLGLESFFPCPKPLYATLTTDSLVPRNDFSRYQDQARELDLVTERIAKLTEMLKVRGVYAGGEDGVLRLFTEGKDGDLQPIANWPAFVEKGGLKGAFELVDLSPIVAALQQLYESRESIKQVIYEVTGISDILRGASAPTETATAQQIKSQFASIRLGEMKADVARFARDLLRMKAEIMCNHYQPQTLVQMSAIQYDEEAGQNPQLIVQAIQLLQDDTLRNFNIDIENDSLVELDEKTEQQNRVEFLGAVGEFMEKAMQAAQMAPDMVPLLGEMMLFGIRGFKVGASLESAFENTFDQFNEKQKQMAAMPPQPSPEDMQAQAEQQQQQMQMQAEQAMQQQQMQHEQEKAQLEQQHSQEIDSMAMNMEQVKADNEAKMQAEMLKAQLQHEITKMQEDTKLKIAIIQAKAAKAAGKGEDGEDIGEDGEDKPSQAIMAVVQQMQQNTQAIAQAMMESNKMLVETLTKELNRPKQLVRNPDGSKMAVPIGDN